MNAPRPGPASAPTGRTCPATVGPGEGGPSMWALHCALPAGHRFSTVHSTYDRELFGADLPTEP